MATAHINIGSNLGDRHGLVRQAVAAIEERFRSHPVVSAPVISMPWGYESGNEFVNVGLNIEVGDMSPYRVMEILQEIERSIDPAPHRDSTGCYLDRKIDIDLIAIDQVIMISQSLVIPHPRMHLREFVLAPMAEVWPQWKHPRFNATPAAMLAVVRLAGSDPNQHTR